MKEQYKNFRDQKQKGYRIMWDYLAIRWSYQFRFKRWEIWINKLKIRPELMAKYFGIIKEQLENGKLWIINKDVITIFPIKQ